MKYLKLFFSTFFALFFLHSCVNSENNTLIIGNWQAIEWLVDGNISNRDVLSTRFSFDAKNQYTFEYAGRKEKGTYKVENDMLFTTPEGETEMMVKIARLTKDTLVFNMNRGGQPELLTLIRK